VGLGRLWGGVWYWGRVARVCRLIRGVRVRRGDCCISVVSAGGSGSAGPCKPLVCLGETKVWFACAVCFSLMCVVAA